jgi:2-(1,2-epoxy-1,2-dihydrophenyl)acetyl-CoA isomerase
MTEPTVLYAEQWRVAIATLNRPQALNSFTRQMHRDLWARWTGRRPTRRFVRW